MRVACEPISQGMRHSFDDVRGWVKAVSLWVTDVQVDDPATGPLQCFRGTNQVTNSVMKIYGSIGRRDHSQFLPKVLVQFEYLIIAQQQYSGWVSFARNHSGRGPMRSVPHRGSGWVLLALSQ